MSHFGTNPNNDYLWRTCSFLNANGVRKAWLFFFRVKNAEYMTTVLGNVVNNTFIASDLTLLKSCHGNKANECCETCTDLLICAYLLTNIAQLHQ